MLLVPGKTLFDPGERDSLAAHVSGTVQQLDPDDQLPGFDDRVKGWLGVDTQGREGQASVEEQVTRLTSRIPEAGGVQVHASPFVVSQVARVDGRTHVFLMNFKVSCLNAIFCPKPIPVRQSNFRSQRTFAPLCFRFWETFRRRL